MSQKDISKVKSVLNDYIRGTYTADIDLLRKLFHADAIMSGFKGELFETGSPEPFFADLASRASMKSAKDPYHADIIWVMAHEQIASATLYQTGFFGTLNIEDHFHLVKGETGEWLIISKLFLFV